MTQMLKLADKDFKTFPYDYIQVCRVKRVCDE